MGVKLKKVKICKERCAACGTCLPYCKKKAIYIEKGCYAAVKEELCVGCGLCVKACPAEALEVEVQ